MTGIREGIIAFDNYRILRRNKAKIYDQQIGTENSLKGFSVFLYSLLALRQFFCRYNNGRKSFHFAQRPRHSRKAGSGKTEPAGILKQYYFGKKQKKPNL